MKKITLFALFLSTLWGYSQTKNCSDATSIYEDFDTYSYNVTTQVLPDCWAKTGTTGSVYIINNSVAPMSPSNKLMLVADGSLPTVAYAVMPPLSNLQAGNYRLKFFCTAGLITNKALELGYFSESGNANSYVPLQAVNLTATTSRQYTVLPGALPPGVKNLVFKNKGFTTEAATIFIDDVIWEPINTCSNVSAIQAKQITMNSVKLSWEPGGSETSWQYVCLPSNILNPNTQTPIDATTASVTVNGLAPSTRYKIWVRSKCSETDFGSWMNSVGFTTLCTPVSQFIENFDAAKNLPPCWGQLGAVTVSSSATYPAPSAPYFLTISSSSPNAIATLPPVSNAGDATNRLSFKIRTSSAGAQMDVGYLTDPANASTFVFLQTVTCNSTTSFENKTLSLGADPKSPYLAFKNPDPTSKIIYIDDVIWEPIPNNCSDITELKATSVKGLSVDLSWTKGGKESAWQYAVGDSTLKDPFSLNPTDIASSTPTISGLNPSTSYKIWVRPKCSGTSFGAWMGPISFTTSCASITDFSQNFDNSTTMPVCWNQIGSTGTVVVSSILNGASDPNALGLSSYSTTSQAVCSMPPVSNADLGTYRLKFKHKASAIGAVLEVGYLKSFSDPTSFAALQSFTSTQIATFDSESIELGTEPATDMLAFRNLGTTYSTIYIDDVIWEPIPPCLDIKNLVPTGLTDTTIGLDWEAGDTEKKWQYVIGSSSVSDPTGLQPVDVATSAVTIDSLNPSTSYKIWIRSLCSANSRGAWVGPLMLTTTCSGVNEFVQNFDASTSLPSCWNKLGAGISGYVDTLPNTPSQSNALYLYGPSPVSNPVIAMPPLSNGDATDHELKFKCRSSVADSVLEVGYLTNPLDAASFVPFKSIMVTSLTEFQTTTIGFGGNPLSNTLAFRHEGSKPGYIYIDDVSWDFRPKTAPACLTGVTATPHPNCGNFNTTISWPAAPNADGYKLSVGTTPGGSNILSDEIVETLSYSVPSVMNTTHYYTVRPYNSVGEARDCVEQTYVTNPKGCYCPSVPIFVDGVGVTNAILGTTSFPGNNQTYYDFTPKTVNLVRGKKANMQITYDLAGHPYNVRTYIDLNDNYIFENSEIFFTGESALVPPSTVDTSFIIPDTASLGNHRMRVSSLDKDNVIDPCMNNLSFYVVLDFNLNVVATDAELDVNSFDDINFSYYPNPVKDILNLSFDQEISNANVVNLLGQQVISKSINANQGKIDMSDLSAGTYLVRVSVGNQLKMIKVLKE